MSDEHSETQLTFDDLAAGSPSELLPTVNSIASALTDSERDRRGDNCATVSERRTETDETVFCIQLPPRSGTVSSEVLETASEMDFTFVDSTVTADQDPPFVTWTFASSEFKLVIVKPIDESLSDLDEDESREDMYVQFDFTKFVRGRLE